jgi:hypothetical protein
MRIAADMEPFDPHYSGKITQRFLAQSQGTKFAILPVGTDQEKKLYGELMRKVPSARSGDWVAAAKIWNQSYANGNDCYYKVWVTSTAWFISHSCYSLLNTYQVMKVSGNEMQIFVAHYLPLKISDFKLIKPFERIQLPIGIIVQFSSIQLLCLCHKALHHCFHLALHLSRLHPLQNGIQISQHFTSS